MRVTQADARRAAVTAALALVALAVPLRANELVQVYEAPQGRTVSKVYAPPAKTPPELFVIDSTGELQHVTNLHGDVGQTTVGNATRWSVSRRATDFGSIDVAIASDGAVETRFTHRDSTGQIGEIDLPHSAHFLLADDASTIVMLRLHGSGSRMKEVSVFDGAGTSRPVPALGRLAERRVSSLALAGNGSRLVADVEGSVLVFDLKDETAVDPLFQLDHAARLAISPSGRHIARIQFDEVILHRDATELRRLTTDGAAHVAFAGNIVAVLEPGQLRIVDLTTGVLNTFIPDPPAELRAVDAVAAGTTTRVAVTTIEEGTATAECQLHIFTVNGNSVSRESSNAFETEAWSRHSPIVRLIGDGAHAFVSTLDQVRVTKD